MAAHASALAAGSVGIATRFTGLLTNGRLRSVMFESDRGCVGVYPMSSTLLLTLATPPDVTPGRFTTASKRAVAIIQAPD